MRIGYQEIKADMLTRIRQGYWAPGALLPNEADLAESYGCARATVNRAMRELARDGFVERRRKAGTRVSIAPHRQARFDIPVVRREIEDRGAVYRYGMIARDMLPAPDWLRARFQLGSGSRVLHLTCMHYSDGMPFQHEDRWINLGLLPEAEQVDFSLNGPTEWLIGAIPFSSVEISMSAVSADKDLAAHLGCAEGAALFTQERATWWEGQAVTHVRLSFPPGHRMTTRY